MPVLLCSLTLLIVLLLLATGISEANVMGTPNAVAAGRNDA